MPYGLVLIGLLMIVTGVQNTYSQFATQLQSDLLGSKGFLVWLLAIGAVGALGYVKDFRTFSHYFLALILIAMILSNQGFFANLQSAIKAGPIAPTPAASGSSDLVSSVQSGSLSPDAALQSHGSGLQGQSNGNDKFNGWLNYLLGIK